MIRINLLPPEFAAVRAKDEQKIIFGTVAVAVAVVLLVILLIKKRRAAELQNNITQAEASLRTYQNVVDQIKTIEQEKGRLTSKRDVIRNLNSSRLIFPVFFEDLLPLIPSDVWVSEIKLEKQTGNQLEYKLASRASSNFALATWLTNLQQSDNFSSVKLERISYEYPTTGTERDIFPVLSFQLGFVYQRKLPMPLSEYN